MAAVIIPFILLFTLMSVFYSNNAKNRGEKLAFDPPTGGSSNSVSCAGVANVPANYMPWVKDAASKWLGGDEAALIAMIQIESSWNPTATPGAASSAGGLGQFLTSTARSMPEFNGGNDGKGKDWPKGTLYPSPGGHSDDARFDPERSIYATAHYMNKGRFPGGRSLGEMYEHHYHGYNNEKQHAAARAGRARLERVYAEVKAKSCTETAVATADDPSRTTAPGRYAPVIEPSILRRYIPLKVHHDGSVAVDIGVPVGTKLYAITTGEVVTVMRGTAAIPYRKGEKSPPGSCGTGIQLQGTDGIKYTYCHMSSLASTIQKGANLSAGDFIGLSGNTGRSTGPHLHMGAKGGLTAAGLRARIESTVK